MIYYWKSGCVECPVGICKGCKCEWHEAGISKEDMIELCRQAEVPVVEGYTSGDAGQDVNTMWYTASLMNKDKKLNKACDEDDPASSESDSDDESSDSESPSGDSSSGDSSSSGGSSSSSSGDSSSSDSSSAATPPATTPVQCTPPVDDSDYSRR